MKNNTLSFTPTRVAMHEYIISCCLMKVLAGRDTGVEGAEMLKRKKNKTFKWLHFILRIVHNASLF